MIAYSGMRHRTAAWLFFDFQTACPSLARRWLMAVLSCMRVPWHIRRIIEQLYADCESLLLFAGEVVGRITVTSGIKQGCPMRGTLFALAVDPSSGASSRAPWWTSSAWRRTPMTLRSRSPTFGATWPRSLRSSLRVRLRPDSASTSLPLRRSRMSRSRRGSRRFARCSRDARSRGVPAIWASNWVQEHGWLSGGASVRRCSAGRRT